MSSQPVFSASRRAVLDIGSHSTLLLIAEPSASGDWIPLFDQSVITRLGEGFLPEKRLQPAAQERTLQAIQEFVLEARRYGVAPEQIRVAGTAVLREAVNQSEFVTTLSEVGLTLRVLSGEEEARFSFKAVSEDPSFSVFASNQALTVVDIGGGSVEIAVGVQEPEHSVSVPLGAVKLKEQVMPSDPPSPLEILRASQLLDERLNALDFPMRGNGGPVVVVGGTGVCLASICLQLSHFEPELIHGVLLDQYRLGQLLKTLNQQSEAERRALQGMESERAPVIHAGALILERVMIALGVEQVAVSVRGLRYGLLLD